MFVTCSLNPKTVHEDIDVGERIVDIVKNVNCHGCTNPCEKYGDKCKYFHPRKLKMTLFETEFQGTSMSASFSNGLGSGHGEGKHQHKISCFS